MAVSKRLRFEILRRDNHACRYCGATAPDVPLTVDHVVPVALGGSNDPSNLVTACRPCNEGKASIPGDAAVVADVAQDAIRWSQAMSLALTRSVDERRPMFAAIAELGDIWEKYTINGGQDRVPIPIDWHGSLERIWLAGLTHVGVLHRNIELAMGAKIPNDSRWAYFCGICWKQVTELQERARRLLDEGMVE